MSEDIPIKVINARALHTSLHARVSYLVEFLAFGATDVEALHIAGRIVRPFIPIIVDSVCRFIHVSFIHHTTNPILLDAKLLSFDITRETFVEAENQHLSTAERLATVTPNSERMRYL